jgi:predicted protein tyrosine phosphatase
VSEWFRSYGFADVHDDLLVGAYPLDPNDVKLLDRLGVRRVLNLVADEDYANGQRAAVESAFAAAGIEETRIVTVDFGHLPPEMLEAAVDEVVSWLRAGDRSYIHCRAGWQRGPAVAAGVVAVCDGIGIEDALSRVQRRKPSANPLPHQREDLLKWFQARRESGQGALTPNGDEG